jgi:hypothetical protein
MRVSTFCEIPQYLFFFRDLNFVVMTSCHIEFVTEQEDTREGHKCICNMEVENV